MTITATATSTQNTAQTSGTSTENSTSSQSTETAKGSKFAEFLTKYLAPDPANKVSEEALFAALARERIVALKGEEAGSTWDLSFAKQKSGLQKPDGFIPYEDVTNAAIAELVQNGAITQEEADKIYAQSFAAAQLDSNTSKLWDSRGGGNDPTVAIASMESALEAARLKIEAFDSGSATPEQLNLSSTQGTGASEVIKPSGSTFDGPNGFLFKPISNNQGTLAVLMPESLAYQVERVLLKDLTGNVLDEGNSTGYGETGEREKFSFSRKGGEYPKDIQVEVHLTDGSTRIYEIPDPSQRYD